MKQQRDEKLTQWALLTLARMDPDKAEGIEAALRAMHKIQKEPQSNVTHLRKR